MRVAGSIITLICAIGVLVGVFLPWISVYGYSISGWDVVSLGGIEGYLALGGGALMTICALPAFIVSVASKGGKGAVVTLGVFATIAALVAAGGAIWALVEILTEGGGSTIGYGLYISIGAPVLGFIFGIVTSATA